MAMPPSIRGCIISSTTATTTPRSWSATRFPTLLCYFDVLPLHVTRPVRWDSDHVVLFDDELREMMTEIVRCGGLKKVLIGLDFFDASINRVAAWVVGTRNAQKALLWALLQPHEALKALRTAPISPRRWCGWRRSQDPALRGISGGSTAAGGGRERRRELVRGM